MIYLTFLLNCKNYSNNYGSKWNNSTQNNKISESKYDTIFKVKIIIWLVIQNVLKFSI